MSPHIMQIVAVLCAAVIFYRAEGAVNKMGPGCPFTLRAAFWLLTVGAAWLSWSVLQGYMPSPATCFALIGVALLLMAERRRCHA